VELGPVLASHPGLGLGYAPLPEIAVKSPATAFIFLLREIQNLQAFTHEFIRGITEHLHSQIIAGMESPIRAQDADADGSRTEDAVQLGLALPDQLLRLPDLGDVGSCGNNHRVAVQFHDPAGVEKTQHIPSPVREHPFPVGHHAQTDDFLQEAFEADRIRDQSQFRTGVPDGLRRAQSRVPAERLVNHKITTLQVINGASERGQLEKGPEALLIPVQLQLARVAFDIPIGLIAHPFSLPQVMPSLPRTMKQDGW